MSCSDEDRDEPRVERLAEDRANRDVARLRQAAIAGTVVAAASLAALARTWWAYAIALVALVAVRFWARRVVEARTFERSAGPRFLVLDEDGIELPRSRGGRTSIRWTELARVEVDHERLLVVLRTTDGREVEIDPTYGGLGLDALARKIDARRLAAEPRHD